MSHGDQLSEIPADFHVIGHTSTAPFAAIVHNDKPWYGIQFHPEVTHSPRGREVIGKFVLGICHCSTHWTMVSDEGSRVLWNVADGRWLCHQEEFIGKEIARIREICGPKGRVI